MTITNNNFKIVNNVVLFTGDIASKHKWKIFSLIKDRSSICSRFLRSTNTLFIIFMINGRNHSTMTVRLNDSSLNEVRERISHFLNQHREEIGI